jgi:hypothetical protein
VFLAAGVFCLGVRRPKSAAALGVIASVLGLTTWWARRYDTMMVGYYVWQASLFALAAGAAWLAHYSASCPVQPSGDAPDAEPGTAPDPAA